MEAGKKSAPYHKNREVHIPSADPVKSCHIVSYECR
jgi:hypothetical protein